jgi:thiol-disulfide isomerase/thioredoxin
MLAIRTKLFMMTPERKNDSGLSRRLPMRNLADLLLNQKVEMVFLLLISVFTSAEKLKEPTRPLVDLNGKPHMLNEFIGSPTVINFWATWCIPCKDEMPRLQKLYERYAGNGIKFVAISIDAADSRGKIPDLLKKRNFRVPVWQGASSETLKELDMGEMVPATVIIDAEGNVVGRIEGEAREKDITSRIDWLLEGRKGKPPKPIQKNDW